jgi:hypothetical protein
MNADPWPNNKHVALPVHFRIAVNDAIGTKMSTMCDKSGPSIMMVFRPCPSIPSLIPFTVLIPVFPVFVMQQVSK